MTKTQNSDVNRSQEGLLRYQLILILLFPILFIYTLLQSLKYGDSKYFRQRLGFMDKPDGSVDIWLHAASVGEVNAALPLLTALHSKYPDKNFLITTTTPTGAKLVQQKKLTYVRHQYLPIDYPWMMKNLIKKNKPKCILIMETEIWPNLFQTCHNRNIAVCTVNGRLSRKTIETRRWIRALYKTTLQFASIILTRSDNDTKSYIALGASPEKVSTIGNIKFSANISAPQKNQSTLPRKYILAASTRPGEELLIATTWRHTKPETSNHLLVIAPRHPNRLNEILQELQNLNMELAVRSKNETVLDTTDIYIVDTVGELIDFMANADIVFVGGSLVPLGGHNILEPAALGKPVLFGPHMNNFENEAEQLLEFNAAIQVKDVDQLGAIVADMLRHPDRYTSLGENAKKIIENNKDIASRYVETLQDFIEVEQLPS